MYRQICCQSQVCFEGILIEWLTYYMVILLAEIAR